MSNITIKAFFDQATYTVTYVINDKASKEAAVIDPVLNFKAASGKTSTENADQLIDYIKAEELQLKWILESHAHADHISSAPYLKEQLGAQTAIGAQISQVQSTFKGVFNMEDSFQTDGSQFDRLLEDGDKIELGDSQLEVLHTPGHTPACLSFKVEDVIFVGDTMFMPDFGTARTDFPGGDASTLYQSIKRILTYPDNTRLFTGHDYMTKTRTHYAWESTIAEQKASNIHVNDKVTEAEFVEYRTTRDATLDLPDLILPAVQVNIRAGALPPKEANGISYLKLPINAL